MALPSLNVQKPKALAMAKPPQVDAPSFTTQNDSVASHMDGLMSQDSPYMRQARTAGLTLANRRGMMNSSMAAGEAQDAAIRAALPIASQDAATAAQKNLSRQNFDQGRVLQRDALDSSEFMQGRDISSRHELLDTEIASREGLAAEERALRERLQGRDIESAQFMQGRDLASREMLALADIAAAKERLGMQLSSSERMALEERNLRREMQQEDIGSAERMQGREIQSREMLALADIAAAKERLGMQLSSSERMALEERNLRREMQGEDNALQRYLQEQDIAYRERAQDADIAANSAERALDRELQEKLASWDLSSGDRNAAAQLLSNMEAMYAENYRSVMANTDLTAEQRTQQLTSIKNLRDAQLSFVEQLYTVDMTW